MAWIRRLPSGLWAATVRTPTGRITKTDRSKGVVADWAAEREGEVRRGDWIDPRAAELTIGELWERWRDVRRLELASRRRDESHWRCHVAPQWAHVQVGAVLRPDVSAWVTKMERAGVGAATIQGSMGVLRALMEYAVDARIRRDNPATGVRMPRRAAHLDRVLTPDEDEQLLAAFDRLFPGRPDARLFVEQLLYSGLRWEEAAALDRDHVDMRRALWKVGPVVERDGSIRPYPKSPAGVRDVPIDEAVWPRVRERVLATRPGGLLFTAPRGGVLDYTTWHRRVWLPALRGVSERPARRGRAHRPAVAGAGLADPQPTPHDLRHTYGTRLAEAGVPVHEIMALMGHERLESAQRYLHAGEDRFERARRAMRRPGPPATETKIMSHP